MSIPTPHHNSPCLLSHDSPYATLPLASPQGFCTHMCHTPMISPSARADSFLLLFSSQSKKGRLTVERDESTGKLVTITEGKGDPSRDVLITVFRNGELVIDQPFSQIRERAAITDAEVPTVA